MSKLTDCLSEATGLALELCWEQWRSLANERVPSHSNHPAMIDPEALVLTSLALRNRERRLDDMLLWMAEEPRSMSVQRLKSMARNYPSSLAADIAWFAEQAKNAGDTRWRSLAATKGPVRGRPGKSMPMMSLRVDSAFMLRVRSGLGVGIKSDLISCLAGLRCVNNRHAGGVTVSELAQILGYSTNATRIALGEMVRAEVVIRHKGRPARHELGSIYFQSLAPGASPGTPANIPPWGYCAQVFQILLACDALVADQELAKAPDVVQASRLRDLAEQFDECWSWFGADSVDATTFPGERFLDGFKLPLGALLHWAHERL